MRFADWYPHYLEILPKLNLDIKKDIQSSLILSGLISDRSPGLNCFKKLTNEKVLVIGAGPSIEEPSIQKFIKDHSNFVIISADGSTELCLELGIVPDFVVTDLDGNMDSLLSSNKLGSTLIIHSHGDNINKILKFVPKFRYFLGTTQVFPLQNVYNFGGFTDGDRCVFLADEFKAAEVWLVGMDFASPVGHFSKKIITNLTLKKKKLSIAKHLIEVLAKKSNSVLLNVSSFKFNSVINGIINYKLK
jgi:2-amino-4-hydroxy-6-hydroxymethyldihydropteridine diphosphokinase